MRVWICLVLAVVSWLGNARLDAARSGMAVMVRQALLTLVMARRVSVRQSRQVEFW